MKKVFLIILLGIGANTFAQNTYVPDDNFEQALIDLGYDDVLDDYVLTSNISGIMSLDVWGSNIHDLTGIEDFTELSNLVCHDNDLTNLDLSANTALTELRCYSNQLTSLDISENTALYYLDCSYNDLTSLDVSECIALTEFWCPGNQLTSLNMTGCIALEKFYCFTNQLTSLDVSANTSLDLFMCDFNQLTSLDISANTALTKLYCSNNLLTSLDISANTALTYFICHDNQLTSLDLSANTALTYLSCNGNQLTSLDVSSNISLDYLWCDDNQLSSLDVSANTALANLYCSNNQLISLDLSKNTVLFDLHCDDNQLSYVDIRNGNNSNMGNYQDGYPDLTNNSNLTCIYVDDKDAEFLSNWDIDPNSTFVETEAECDALDVNGILVKGFAIYPNPTTGFLFFDFAENNIQIITITNITGKQIIDKKVKHHKEQIDLSGYASGIYIINIQMDEDIYTTKIIKR